MYKNRQVYKKLEKQINNNKATILIGPRQVGKTTLMKQLYATFKKNYPCLYLDLDIYSNYEKVSTYENCINTLKLNGYSEDSDKRFVLFLDEFQRYDDISVIIKNIVDNHPNVKIYASGSSSLSIRDKIQESLAGRKRIVNIYPLSFREYLHFIDRDDLIIKVEKLSEIKSDSLMELVPDLYQELNHFLIYGGYPEVALTPISEKKEVLESIFDLYVKKDLVDFLKIDRIKNAKMIINHLAINHGQQISFNLLSQIAGVDDKTAKNYVEILKETFLIKVSIPWYTNKNKELVKMPKIYFIDNGVRNYFINNFNLVDLRDDASFLFEGFVISELLKMDFPDNMIKFWRTKSKQEIDIILDYENKVKPVEIKYKKNLKKSDFLGLKNFVENYPQYVPCYLINLGSNKSDKENIVFLSPFEIETLKR
ncbi:ATP-binding protein [Deferribacter autotrophicus]|uniref:ATP-binding protein n=1 Tax=Deferribacter autotrophicus TaxID=500465 RepID=A0A5A8F5X9_9BACT|nr:ATP-binding protein [Deferribacter autotrophicus]KAA0259110.1 ATP-binding protein [Deferribacter autotrophicus]